jgi:hypothetical protein
VKRYQRETRIVREPVPEHPMLDFKESA